ncbi:MAG: DUF3551 domain-containing protein [Bradyrhizobiaceae bacterium]|nr:MAG: DUF3551 domain-containing protein [Bradyrhizobiaceae bacterium]
MKMLMIGIAAGGLSMLAATAPSQARDYKYCLYEGGEVAAGDCSFVTYAQCQASASGRVADCRINPRWAYGRQLRR